MSDPRPDNNRLPPFGDDDAFSRLLDSTLRSDLTGRGRPRVDVASSVLGSLGFRRMERATLRRRTLRRHGVRLLQSTLLLAAALGGVVANNAAPSAIRADASIPRALDRAIDDGLNGAGAPRLDQFLRNLELFDPRLIESVREISPPPSATDPGNRERSHDEDPAGDPAGDSAGDGDGDRDSTATAPYRWV